MAQTNYTCLVAFGFVIMAVAFGLAVTSLLTTSWLMFRTSYYGIYSSNNYYILGPCIGGGCSGTAHAEAYQVACLALMIVGVILSSLGVFFLFLYLCGSCCCKISQWMTVMPKLNMVCAALGSASVGVACAVFLIGFYWTDNKSWFTGSSIYSSFFVPGFSFYLACVSAVLMFISGVVAIGAKNATRVDVIPINPQGIVVNASVNQSSSYPGQPQPYYPYQPQPGPGYYLPGSSTPHANNPVKIFVANTATQTSETDLKGASAKPVKSHY